MTLGRFVRSRLPAARKMLIALVVLVAVGALPASEIIADNERTLSFKNMHTGETLTVTFKKRGRYQTEAMRQINWIMRDWRRDEVITVDPRLIDLVYDVHKAVGSRVPIEILSGYRSPATNAALRRRSRNVARFSQHMVGKAMDFRIRDVNVRTVRETAMKMQRGGVGYYNGTYLHLDVASVRAWPRMSRSQLMRLFPDGKTVHMPSDGRPLPGYEAAKREIARSGGTSGSNELAEDDLDTDRRSISQRGSDDAGLVLAGNERYVADAQPTRATVRERGVNDNDSDSAAAVATPPQATTTQSEPAQQETNVRLPATVPTPRSRPQPPVAVETQVAAVDPTTIRLPPTKPDISTLIAAADEQPTPSDADNGGIQSLIASADTVPLPRQRPLIGAPPSTTTFAQSDGASAITALLAEDLPSSLSSTGLRGTLPAGIFEQVALVTNRPSLETVGILVSAPSVAHDGHEIDMHHPDQSDVGSLLQLPMAILDNGFNHNRVEVDKWLRSEFAGSAIEILQTRLFLDTSDVKGSIEDLLTTSSAGLAPNETQPN